MYITVQQHLFLIVHVFVFIQVASSILTIIIKHSDRLHKCTLAVGGHRDVFPLPLCLQKNLLLESKEIFKTVYQKQNENLI